MRGRRDFFLWRVENLSCAKYAAAKGLIQVYLGQLLEKSRNALGARCRIGGRASAFHLKIPEGKMSETNLRNAPVAHTLCERRIIGAARERISFAGSEKQA
jgi:hypothetical protein